MGKDFNLLDESWLLVLDNDGKEDIVSLLEIFRRAHEFKRLAGELPAQDVALLRLLLAVLYAVFTRVDPDGNPSPLPDEAAALQRWRELWELRRFPMGPIEKHLENYRERFWLFHPQTPFWQVVFTENPVNKNGITLKPTPIYAPKFIGDIADGNKPNMFGGRTQKNKLPFPEAARWLAYLNAFDVSPAGTPGTNPKEKTVKGFGHPWPANIGLIWASGNTLFETLMLNFVLVQPRNQEPWPVSDKDAWWEQPSPCTNAEDLERIGMPPPQNPLQLLSAQYRYVTLRRDKESVIGYELWSGIQFDAKNMFTEQMTLWREKDGDHLPRQHDPAKQMWRDFAAFVPGKADDENPGIVTWIAALKTKGFLDLPVLRLHIAGIEYTNNTSVADVFSDGLQFHASLLAKLGENWVMRIKEALGKTEECVDILGNFARDLEKCVRYEGDSKRDKERAEDLAEAARERAYGALDKPFRDWLLDINPDDGRVNTIATWLDKMREKIYEMKDELLAEAGEAAFVGRYVEKENKKTRRKEKEKVLYSAPIVEARFYGKIRNTLGEKS